MWQRMTWQGWGGPNKFAAAMALTFVILAGIFAEYQSGVVFQQSQHARVAERLALIRSNLEGEINANIQLVRGLVSVVASEPDMDQARFAQLSEALVEDHSHLRNIAAAPDLKISLMYPIEGNEQAIGLDYRNEPAQWEAANAVRESGRLVIAGPVDLVQGGRGLVGRYPVFADGEDGKREFWGLVAAVVDVDALFSSAGLYSADDLSIAIVGRDGKGADGAQFFGSPSVLDATPETTEVILPSGGSWHLAAIPAGGWQTNHGMNWALRSVFGIAAALIVIPILISGRLVDERQRHIHDMRQREEAMERLSHRLELALDTSKIGIWELNVGTGELFWDDRMKELYGLDPDQDVTGYETWRGALHSDDLAQAEREFKRVIDGEERYHSAFRVDLGNGQSRHIRAIGAAYLRGGTDRHIVGVNWDVSQDVEMNERLKKARDLAEARNDALEDAKAQMEHNALHDPLTGLPNRRYLDKILNGGETVPPFALMHIDLDRFKQINDTFGHAAGDNVLRHMADILRRHVREGDFVARVGGDEFVVAFMKETNRARLAALAVEIIEAMRQPVSYEGHDCRAGVSVGIALAQGKPGDLLINADIALYEAKSRGRNRYEFFTLSLQRAAVRNKTIADEIMLGIERDEFLAHYQPQHDAATLKIVGAEVLVRWQHPTRGLLPPSDFLHIAEEINALAAIDQRVLERASLQSLKWMAEGVDMPKLSVNISSARLRDERLIESVQGLAFEPGRLAFELVESTFLDDDDDIISTNVHALKTLGIDIEIDDFGTGYASIISLMKIKPRRLKIDRQLVAPIGRSPAQRQLVASIIEIGKSLDIEVIAEGIETNENVNILRRLGCSTLQGYLFARPLDPDAFADYYLGHCRSQRAAKTA